MIRAVLAASAAHRMTRRVLNQVLLLMIGAVSVWAQGPAAQPGATPVAAPLTVLVHDLVDLFPSVRGDVIEVRDAMLTLDVGRKDGARPGLQVELFREGRDITHPKTGAVLGKAEEPLGRVRLSEVQEAFSLAPLPAGGTVKPGDRFRVSSGKIHLVLLPL